MSEESEYDRLRRELADVLQQNRQLRAKGSIIADERRSLLALFITKLDEDQVDRAMQALMPLMHEANRVNSLAAVEEAGTVEAPDFVFERGGQDDDPISLHVNFDDEDLDDLVLSGHILQRGGTFAVSIEYPLITRRVFIGLPKTEWTARDVAMFVRASYREAYKDRANIFGHVIDDLTLERIEYRDGVWHLFVGS